MTGKKKPGQPASLDEVVAAARRDREARDQGYRERALKMYPWVCGRCGREFTRSNLHELTVHHRDHDHDNNPEDGSNWELLCLYCHDNEHQRHGGEPAPGMPPEASTELQRERGSARPFAGLREILERSKKK